MGLTDYVNPNDSKDPAHEVSIIYTYIYNH